MGLEFAYQTKYDSTIDTLALRDNVNKILQNAALKTSAASVAYTASPVVDTVEINTKLTQKLTNTVNFLESEDALKLLNLTKRHTQDYTQNNAEIIDFKIDETKANIFAA